MGYLHFCNTILCSWIIGSWHLETTWWSQNFGNQLPNDMASYLRTMVVSPCCNKNLKLTRGCFACTVHNYINSHISSWGWRQRRSVSQQEVIPCWRICSEKTWMTVKNVCLCDIFRFLPTLAQQALDTVLSAAGINRVAEPTHPMLKVCELQGNILRIWNTTAAQYETATRNKVSDVVFFDVQQVRMLSVVCVSV